MNLRDLRRWLKRIDKEIKTHNQGSGLAYDMYINDRGAAQRRWQATMDGLLERRTAVAEQIKELE